MKILGIETSCDETGASVIEVNTGDKTVKLLSNVVASSLSLHAKTGGIIPEVAAREQLSYILPTIEEALRNAKMEILNLDAIAVTYGPGLIGSLLVGVETAKTLALVYNKPLIPVNHLIGHIYANWIDHNPIFPALSLIASGGHTDLVLMKDHGKLTWLGGTRDDAAGEAFDKIGRLLGLPYPAGPTIARLAEKGDVKAFRFPRPMLDSRDFDFSFSGLKAAVLREVKTIEKLDDKTIANISASVEQAIVDVLVTKTIAAAKQHSAKSILLSGGVAANKALREQLQLKIESTKSAGKIDLHAPPPNLCTDNAAMIATAAFFTPEKVSLQKNLREP